MQENHEIIPVGGHDPGRDLDLDEIRGAALRREPLTPAAFAKAMDVRVSFGRYFEPCDEGRYAHRAR